MKNLPTKNGKIVKDAFWINGLGWVREITLSRLNESGINEPYIELEILNWKHLWENYLMTQKCI